MIFHLHFISWIGSVTTIIVKSFNFYPLYCLHEDGHMSGRNMWEVIILYRKTISLMSSLYIYIQGVPGGMCNTSGGCSLC
jgi:hypothetical protein